jgi:hypothetical protein
MSRFRLPFGILLGWLASIVCFGATPVWRWSNPVPHGAHIFGLASSGSTVVQVGEFGQAYATDDLVQWRPLATGVTNMLRSAMWLGPRLVITGSDGVILYSDTLDFFQKVDLGTSDWIEGVAASAARLVAVGDNGVIYISNDGAIWTKQATAGEWLRSVAFGNGTFVAVGDAGYITTSPAGMVWTTQPRLLLADRVPRDLNRVRFSGGRFWALGNEGAAFISTNGIAWSTLDLGTTNDLFSAACNGTNAVIVGRSEMKTSVPPFETWQSEIGESPRPPAWTYYSALYDGAEFLIGGRSGMFVEGFRPTNMVDFVWFPSVDSPRNWLWGIHHVDGLYVAAGEKGGVFTSIDGFRFDQEVVPTNVVTEIFEGVGGTTNVLLAVGTGGTMIWSPSGYTNVVSTNSIGELITNQVSLLGLIWNEVRNPTTNERPTTNELQGVGVFGTNFIVTGGKGTILVSSDPTQATQWLPRISGVNVMLSSVASSPERVVVSGDFGTIVTSDDSLLWGKRSSGVTNWVYQVRYLNGKFVAVGEAGLILTSPDGLTWNRQTSGTEQWLNAVNFQSGNYYIAGGQGTILQSADAVNWTLLPTPTGKSLYDVVGAEGRVFMVGLEGAAIRTRVAPWQNPVNFLGFEIQTDTQAFLVSGEYDQRFILQRSADFLRWFDTAPAEILDNSGTSIFYDAVIAGAQWFFRTRLIQP